MIFMRPIKMNETQLIDLMEKLGAVYARVHGKNVQADHCFLHGNNSPTLGINIESGKWNCFSCGKKGNSVIELVAAAKKIHVEQAYSWILETFPDVILDGKFSLKRKALRDDTRERYELSEAVMAAYDPSANEDIGYRASAYYLGIDKPMTDKLGLGYDRLNHRLIFPVRHEDGVLGGLIGRCLLKNIDKRFRWYNYDSEQFKKSEVIMGGELPVDKTKPLLIVEGPRDYCKIRSFGYDNVRATLGISFSDFQIDHVVRTGCNVVPLYDEEDNPHVRKAISRLKKALKSHTHILSYRYPEGYADENGKTDPACLDAEGFGKLVDSFRRGFNFGNFARKKR
jgi:hypothetical protein